MMAGFLKGGRHSTSNAPDDLKVISVRETRHPYVFEVICESETFDDVLGCEIPPGLIITFVETP
jgi:hypothetical protein